MGMTLEESIKWVEKSILEMRNRQFCTIDKHALRTVIEIACKYQKIEQLIANYEEYKWERIDVKDIREIIDGNLQLNVEEDIINI